MMASGLADPRRNELFGIEGWKRERDRAPGWETNEESRKKSCRGMSHYEIFETERPQSGRRHAGAGPALAAEEEER